MLLLKTGDLHASFPRRGGSANKSDESITGKKRNGSEPQEESGSVLFAGVAIKMVAPFVISFVFSHREVIYDQSSNETLVAALVRGWGVSGGPF